MNQQSASKMLKVTGILSIIFGAISIVASLILLFGYVLLATAANAIADSATASAVSGLLTLAVIIAIIASVAEFVAGILGVVNANKPEKANVCFIFGIINIVIGIASIILNISSGEFNIISIVSALALPVLYTIAAYFLKNGANNNVM